MLEHNEKTLHEVEAYIEKNQSCCVVNPCGSGKTMIMSGVMENHPDKSFVIFTKQKNAKNYYNNKNNIFKRAKIVTYAQMRKDYVNKYISAYDADYYLMDEAHYLGATKWNEAFTFLTDTFKPTVIGFTATPQRFEDQGTEMTIVKSLFGGRSAGNYTSKQLQKKGVFKEPEYVLSLFNMQSEIDNRIDKIISSDLDETIRNHYLKKLNSILESWKKESCPEKVLAAKLPDYMYKPESNRILVYVSRINDVPAKMESVTSILKNIFKGKTITSYSYTSKDSESNLKNFLKEDDSYIKVLFSINKIMETVHIDDLNIAIMLRPSVSDRIIIQQFGRLNSINNPRKPLIIDMVDNLSNLGQIKFLSDISNKRERKSIGNYSFITNISYVKDIKSLFDSIDKATSRFKSYEYNGFTGSLTQICEVYNKRLSDVKTFLKSNPDIYAAMEQIPDRSEPIMKQHIFDGYIKREEDVIPLNHHQQELVEENLKTVENFIKTRNIIDEDEIQELYITMMETVQNYGEGYMKINILNRLAATHTKCNRYAVLRQKALYDKGFHQTENEIIDNQDLADMIQKKQFEENLDGILSEKLTERQKFIIKERFGIEDGEAKTLEQIGHKLSICRDRVRQIEAKALRNLRSPYGSLGNYRRTRDLMHDIMDDYSNENHMMETPSTKTRNCK